MSGMPRLPVSCWVLPAAMSLMWTAACASSRYVAIVRPQPPPTLAPHAGDLSEADGLLEEARRSAEASGLLAGLSETIALVLDGQLAYTVVLADGRATVLRARAAAQPPLDAEPSEGSAPPAKLRAQQVGRLRRPPTLVVPVTMTQLRNLRLATSDGKLDEQEIFHFGYVLFAPCLKRIHGMFYFTDPGNKKTLGADDFMHFAIKNPSGLTYHGEKVVVGATVLNVDGFFFHLPGLTGDPDVRYEFSIPEALSLYRLLVYEAERQRANPLALLKMGNEVRDRLTRAITYTRPWH